MTGYTRNDGPNNIADGNIVQASDIDGEYDAIEAAFNASTGHTHDGTAAEGAPIEVVGPAQDLVVTAAKVEPKTDNTLDLGSSAKEFKDLYLDGTANIDSLVADTADINGGTADNVTIGGGTAAAGTFTTATATTGNITNVNATTVDTTNVEVTNLKAKDGTSAGSIADSTGVVTLASSVLTTTDINGGTIDGATIATSDITVGSGKTLDVSAGTLTLANDQISGDKINGGTIGSVTITSLTATSADINGGTIDGVTIGGASAGAGTFTTLQANTSLNVDGTVTADGLTVENGNKVRVERPDGATYSEVSMNAGGSGGMRFFNNNNDGFTFDQGNGQTKAFMAGNGDISFYEDTGTTPKLFWDASAERLGIGTTSPSALLDSRGLSLFGDQANGIVYLTTPSSSEGRIGTGGRTSVTPMDLTFYTSDSGSNQERLRIDSGGNLLVGTTSKGGTEKFALIGTPAFNMAHPSTGTLGVFRTGGISGTIVGSIVVTGSSTSYNTSSDYRLKENVVDMNDAINRVKALKPSRFNFIADPDKTVDGFLAHEAQEVVPEAVTGEKDAVGKDGKPVMQGIDQSKLVPLLTGALKEAIARIETLEAEVATLKGA